MKGVFLILLCILCSPTSTYAASNYYYETTQQLNYTKRALLDVEIVGEETSVPEPEITSDLTTNEDMWEPETTSSAQEEEIGDEVIEELVIDEEIISLSADDADDELPLLSDGEYEVITSTEDENNTEK